MNTTNVLIGALATYLVVNMLKKKNQNGPAGATGAPGGAPGEPAPTTGGNTPSVQDDFVIPRPTQDVQPGGNISNFDVTETPAQTNRPTSSQPHPPLDYAVMYDDALGY